jgi:predicted N-formylglutamate amidohydrolase
MYNDAVDAAEDSAPAAYSVYRPQAGRPLLLVCDHASAYIPAAFAGLGLPRDEIERHIGWDIGAAAVTRMLADDLDATAVLSGVSRLVVDCNRALDDPTLIPVESDGVAVPGNRGLAPADRTARIDAWFHSYHAAIDRELARLEQGAPVAVLISIHSFTPRMQGGQPRPWPVGVLWDRDPRLAVPVIAALQGQGFDVGDNEPYSGRTGQGDTIDRHAADHGRPHVAFEIRQDLIGNAAGIRQWADILAQTIEPLLDQPAVKERRHY